MSIQTLPQLVPGDDYPLVFTFTLADLVTPDPQTGNSIFLMVKKTPDDLDANALFSTTVAASAPDAANGIIKVTIPHATTRNFDQGSQVYVQARQIASGIYRTVLIGSIPTANSIIDQS
jgi:hypothetical protein